MDSTNIENDDAKEIREDRENRGDLEGLYDLAIPLSMPITVIAGGEVRCRACIAAGQDGYDR